MLTDAKALVARDIAPLTSEATALAKRLADLAREHDLGDPITYARWCCAMGTLSEAGESMDLEPADRAAWEYLIAASRTAQTGG